MKKSRTFLVTTRTVVEKQYEVKAPTSAAALVPIEQLVEHWPCRVIAADTGIYNVVPKKRRK